MTEIRELEAPIIIDVHAKGDVEEDWNEEEECIWEDTPSKRNPEPYEMERWRTEQELNAVFYYIGTTDKAINEICDMTDDLPWFWQEPLLHRYAARYASNHRKKLREAFQRADIGAHKLAEVVQESDLRPPISDWKSFFKSAAAWKEILRGLASERTIMLWNYYLIEAAYTDDFERERHHEYVFVDAHAADVMWTTWNDKKMEDELHRGKTKDAVAAIVDRKILSGYLAMRALDLDTVLKLARDATSQFEQDMPHLERRNFRGEIQATPQG